MLNTVVLAGIQSAGGQAGQIAILENYPGVYPPVDGLAFVDAMTKQAVHFGAHVVSDEAVSLDKVENNFVVHTKNNKYSARAVLLATGAKPRKLCVKGETELMGKGVSYCATCDGPFFKGKRITVVGGGDSALSEALYLATLTPYVTIVHRRETFRASPALQARVHEKDISLEMGQTVKEITGRGKVDGIVLQRSCDGGDGERLLECDAVFICAGHTPQTGIADFLKKDSGGYFVTGSRMQTACPGLFAAGDVRSTPLRQVITAASDGAVAAYAAAEYIRNGA